MTPFKLRRRLRYGTRAYVDAIIDTCYLADRVGGKVLQYGGGVGNAIGIAVLVFGAGMVLSEVEGWRIFLTDPDKLDEWFEANR